VSAVIPLGFLAVFFLWPVAAIIGRSLTAGALHDVIAMLRCATWRGSRSGKRSWPPVSRWSSGSRRPMSSPATSSRGGGCSARS
jgi:hypothetical protein